MSKLPLFITYPCAETIEAALEVIEASGFFAPQFFSPDSKSPMIQEMRETKPGVCLFSLGDPLQNELVFELLVTLRNLRIEAKEPARDPAFRVVLLAEDRGFPTRNWVDLGVHEILVAPLLPKTLSFKLARHYHKAVAAAETQKALALESPPSGEVDVPEQKSNAPKEWRNFLGSSKESNEPAAFEKVVIKVSGPGLPNPDKGDWQAAPEEEPGPSEQAADDLLWTWVEVPRSTQHWAFKGDRPIYDRASKQWVFLGEAPILRSTNSEGIKEDLITFSPATGRIAIRMERPDGTPFKVHSVKRQFFAPSKKMELNLGPQAISSAKGHHVKNDASTPTKWTEQTGGEEKKPIPIRGEAPRLHLVKNEENSSRPGDAGSKSDARATARPSSGRNEEDTDEPSGEISDQLDDWKTDPLQARGEANPDASEADEIIDEEEDAATGTDGHSQKKAKRGRRIHQSSGETSESPSARGIHGGSSGLGGKPEPKAPVRGMLPGLKLEKGPHAKRDPIDASLPDTAKPDRLERTENQTGGQRSTFGQAAGGNDGKSGKFSGSIASAGAFKSSTSNPSGNTPNQLSNFSGPTARFAGSVHTSAGEKGPTGPLGKIASDAQDASNDPKTFGKDADPKDYNASIAKTEEYNTWSEGVSEDDDPVAGKRSSRGSGEEESGSAEENENAEGKGDATSDEEKRRAQGQQGSGQADQAMTPPEEETWSGLITRLMKEIGDAFRKK